MDKKLTDELTAKIALSFHDSHYQITDQVRTAILMALHAAYQVGRDEFSRELIERLEKKLETKLF